MVSAREALRRLVAGNRRFVKGGANGAHRRDTARRAELTLGQDPFAIILGCSDSRVPAELVFDQGLGDLFVIRVAGNIAAPSQVGSVEFATSRFHTRLVVVLGHSQCGAVHATLDELRHPAGAHGSSGMYSIVDRIRPSVESLLHGELLQDAVALVHHAIRSNVCASADQLRRSSDILKAMIRDDGLRVVGAEYSIETGIVEFFDGAEDLIEKG